MLGITLGRKAAPGPQCRYDGHNHAPFAIRLAPDEFDGRIIHLERIPQSSATTHGHSHVLRIGNVWHGRDCVRRIVLFLRGTSHTQIGRPPGTPSMIGRRLGLTHRLQLWSDQILTKSGATRLTGWLV
ncbi:hypothetical protein FVE85_2458 [Porphyridium purpureum]|uniref:Uncharacterized protein n=1 Tax=Porphyridium purpureum TaxID=35688 RepID=A0A5J4YLC4_PORPP|nr:hypothetical protein FVE85_2458 [Porphyridium purpureum]|eukprot:POR4174..scf291_13